jgi:hypothetical protein
MEDGAPPTVGPLRGAADGTEERFARPARPALQSMTGLADETLVRLTVEIGLDVQRFVADLAAHRYLDRIREEHVERRAERRERDVDVLCGWCPPRRPARRRLVDRGFATQRDGVQRV